MHDLAIVGAGPAGMAAALAVAEAGFSVVVVDEQARAGGQIFRRPPEAWGERHGTYRPYTWARDLIERFEDHPGIKTHFRSTVFGVLRDRDRSEHAVFDVAVSTPVGGQRITSRRLLLATGAYDMPVAFPGWTLPGVMTAGAVQSLLKSQKVLAGKRVVLVGSHPIQLILAGQLLDAGADLVEIALARDMPGLIEMAQSLRAIPGHLSIFAEGARALVKIARHRVPISRRTVVSEAVSKDNTLDVRLSQVDRDWKKTGINHTVEADVLALGYGFTPSTELARQVGCDLIWNSAGGGWTVSHDTGFQSSAPDVFVAGEPTGVAGAERAWAEGHMAGLTIAASLGATIPPVALAQARRRLTGSARFACVMQAMFAPRRAALAELSRQEETVICRCETVRNGKIEKTLQNNPFIQSASAVKLECRSGMGPCQGRYCEGTVAARVAEVRKASIEASGYFSAHLPVKPVPLQDYRDIGEE
ncbi:NAD(P)/FAD-dependent oxidoreductase [Celeribacter baekdonensis]|uniref:FAD/NAD(P)-dependent oxidoreductase n=1 Tax=Celeribacter baekdonensis TaxID=875171 RepID=UPI0030DB3A37